MYHKSRFGRMSRMGEEHGRDCYLVANIQLYSTGVTAIQICPVAECDSNTKKWGSRIPFICSVAYVCTQERT
jgi:hypothetical protein